MKRLIGSIIILCLGYALNVESDNKFNYNILNSKKSSLNLMTDLQSTIDLNGFKKITESTSNHTVDPGMPELPTYTTFYQVDPEKEYEIELVVHDSYTLNDVMIYPHQSNSKDDDPFLINTNFYNSNDVYPSSNIASSDRMHSRGFDIISIQVVPYNFYPNSNELEVLTDVEVIITEVGPRVDNINTTTKRSRVFDSLFKDYVINFETSSRTEDYQLPSILYICGGNSESSSALQDLVEWRHQQGYVVNTASLSETGNSENQIKNYIQNAYNTWENPPEYVALVGDVGGNYSVPTFYNGFGHNSYGNDCEGDLPYSQLDGNDLLPEVIVGRISVRSNNELGVVVAKTLAYEKATYIDITGTNWYESAALIGDPSSSGQSTIHTNQYIDNLLQNHGFNDVNTAFSGNYDGFMEDQLEDGVLYMNYRGYLGVSGFGEGEVNDANSGYKTPFATVLTCGTGSFAEDNTCIAEALLRYGSVSNPKGAVASVATATWNTHTLFNNVVAMGMYDGIFSQDLPTSGMALAAGKLALLHTYPSSSGESWVSAFTQWNNLMGDPAILLWTDTPSNFNVSHPSSINIGSNIIDITINDELGNPIKDAWVTILKGNDEIFKTSLSDDSGNVTFDWNGATTAGNITLTITKRNFIPYQQNIVINDSGDHVEISGIVIDDSVNGNNDGFLNPGEYAELQLNLSNIDSGYLTNITGVIESNSENVYTESNIVSFQNINSGQSTLNSYDPFFITLDYSAINQQNLNVRLNLNIDGVNHTIYVPIDVVAGDINVIDVSDYDISVGEVNDLYLTVRNDGQIPMENLIFQLLPYENLVTVPSSITNLAQINQGQEQVIGPFQINVSDEAIKGSILPMILEISSTDGLEQNKLISLQLGRVGERDPLGPDAYGYYIYDNNDSSYDLAPTYDWIELDNGLGTAMSFDDDGDGNGSNLTEVIDLPFSFRFYGIDYNQITIAVDGYMSFGNNEVACHRNYPIPGPGGPSPMIAPFWDDLKTGSSGNIYKYITDEMVVIQWDYLRTYENNDRNTFQVILYNSDYNDYETVTGDGEIKIQYYDFNNTSNGSWSSYPPMHTAYATIGIKNHLGNTGLQYSFNNEYANAAMQLSDNTALFITTGRANNYLIGDINADESINILDVVQLVNLVLGADTPDGYQIIVSDINSDGQINILDVVQLVNLVLG